MFNNKNKENYENRWTVFSFFSNDNFGEIMSKVKEIITFYRMIETDPLVTTNANAAIVVLFFVLHIIQSPVR